MVQQDVPDAASGYVLLVAETLHEQWRREFRAANGPDAVRFKDDSAGGRIDIAATGFAALPSLWQHENLMAATAVVARLRQAMAAMSGVPDGGVCLEAIADGVHEDWMSRNAHWAPESLLVPYAALDEVEKEKDRVVVRAAATVMRVPLR